MFREQTAPISDDQLVPSSETPGSASRKDDSRAHRGQISTWLPSSTTRFVGKRKNCIALSALRSIQAKIFSRQGAMPGVFDVSRVCRARKKLVSIIRNGGPHTVSFSSASGTSLLTE